MYGFGRGDNINKPTSSKNHKRGTAKGLPVFEHHKYGRCVIITRESLNQKWSLVGGGIDNHEGPSITIAREIEEEFGDKIKILRKKDLGLVHTHTSRHRIYALQIKGILNLDTKELDGIGFYPLGKTFETEREALEVDMDYHAKIALQHFMNDRKTRKYEASEIKIPGEEFEKFKKMIAEALRETR